MIFENIYTASRTMEGAGFEVQRAIPNDGLEFVGPFIMLDHIGPVDILPGEAVGAPTHPHSGIETISYFIEGSGLHFDSLGNRAITHAGEMQWMRAGRGIVHDEGPDEDTVRNGGRNHMVQLWLNMPGNTKHDAPEYRSYRREDIPVVKFPERNCVRVLAGTMCNVNGPLITHGNPLLAHLTLSGKQHHNLELPELEQLGVFVLSGSAQVNDAPIEANRLLMISGEKRVKIDALGECDLLLLGGDKVNDTLVRYGPFVANSQAEMKQTIYNHQRGSFGELQK